LRRCEGGSDDERKSQDEEGEAEDRDAFVDRERGSGAYRPPP
jgi:hypothetical protein